MIMLKEDKYFGFLASYSPRRTEIIRIMITFFHILPSWVIHLVDSDEV